MTGTETLQYVYLFDEVDSVESRVGGDWDAVRGLLGGKGANLADVSRLDVRAVGGGGAELLRSLLRYSHGTGVDARWLSPEIAPGSSHREPTAS